jgi:hypothetical protein
MADTPIIFRVIKGIWAALDVVVDLIVLALIAFVILLAVGASTHRPHVPARRRWFSIHKANWSNNTAATRFNAR